MFSIDAESGNITTSGDLHFSTSSEIKLVVQATDLGENAIPSSTTVTVRAAELNLHAPEVLVQSLDGLHQLTVIENSPPDTFIAHVLVSDPDFGSAGRVDCRLENNGDEENFHLVPLFPDSMVGSQRDTEYTLVSRAVFDRENRSAYQVALSCRDFGEPDHVTRLSLDVEVADVDDNEPMFAVAAYNFSVPENNRRGQVIGRVSATDADYGPNARVVYSVGASSLSFSVDASSGVISARVSFDREFVDHFQFVVLASSGSTSSSQVRSQRHY